MTEQSKTSGVAILPVVLIGLIVGGVVFIPQGEQRATSVPTPLDSVDEARIVEYSIERGLTTLPEESGELRRAERHLLLRLNGAKDRTLEVAGGMYAIASKHLDQGHTPEAMRVAQACADLVPGSPLAARSWMLCGTASAATHPDLPLSIRYFERAEAALRERLLQSPDEAESLRLRASAVQWLGQSKDRFGRTEEAIRHLRELTGTEPVARIQPPADRLRAMLTLGRLLLKTDPSEEAQRWLTSAREFGFSEEVPAAEALHALVDSTRSLAPDLSDPARLEALRTYWEAARFATLPEWFQVGDELASAYFFHEPRQIADFEIVSRQLLTTLPGVLESLPIDSQTRAGLDSLYATNLLLAVDSARSRGDDTEVTRLVKLFETAFDSRDVKFTSPLDRPAQRMHRIGEIYRSTMTGHVEQLRQLQTSGTEAPRL